VRSIHVVENAHIARGISSCKWLIIRQKQDIYFFSQDLFKNSSILTDYHYVSDALFFMVADHLKSLCMSIKNIRVIYN
jgi:hypothetical protein